MRAGTTMKPLWLLLALPVFAYAVACIGFFLAQRSFIYYPTAGRDPSVAVTTLRRQGVALQVSVHQAPGPRAVVYFGGNAEDVSRAVGLLREAFDGAAVYALHYRGYGGSEGVPTERDLVDDATALVAQVATRHPDIVLVGRSLGSGVAVQVARRHPPRRLVLVTPFDSMTRLARRHAPWLPTGLLLRERYESVAHAPSVRAPTTLIVAGRDTIVPPSHARALQEAFAPGTARTVLIPGAGHNDVDAHPGFVHALRGN